MNRHIATVTLVMVLTGGSPARGAVFDPPPQTPQIEVQDRADGGDEPSGSGTEQQQQALTTTTTIATADSFPPKDATIEATLAHHEHPDDAAEFYVIRGYKVGIGELLLIAVTALLFFATAGLWVATRALVRGAERTAEQELRAYVAIHACELHNLPISNKLGFIFFVRNYGKTPARRMVLRMDIDLLGERGGSEPSPSAHLAPGQESKVAVWCDGALSEGQIQEVVAERAKIAIRGEFTYLDIFGRERRTYFNSWCFGHDAKVGDILQFTARADGNDFD